MREASEQSGSERRSALDEKAWRCYLSCYGQLRVEGELICLSRAQENEKMMGHTGFALGVTGAYRPHLMPTLIVEKSDCCSPYRWAGVGSPSRAE